MDDSHLLFVCSVRGFGAPRAVPEHHMYQPPYESFSHCGELDGNFTVPEHSIIQLLNSSNRSL